jgi:hypothetical protein
MTVDPHDGLMDFQRNTVDYVLRRFYTDPQPASRFLVADEVGMGKTMVARGVIAGAIQQLQDDDSVDRIDVVYICSNADIARQNVSRLDVVGDGTRALSTRISMLATQVRDLDRPPPPGGKTVNLIAFTPGTSFSRGHAGGKVAERALLAHLVAPLVAQIDSPTRVRNALRNVLRGNVSDARWSHEVEQLTLAGGEPDPAITERFRAALLGSDLLGGLNELIAETIGRQLPVTLKNRRAQVVRDLRHQLARNSIEALEPDLVILDEFQRFKHLLVDPDDGDEAEVSQLANDLFNYKGVKTLLISATPYKMYTLAEEQELSGDHHFGDFLATVRFLAGDQSPSVVPALSSALRELRDRLVIGGDASRTGATVEGILRQVMCRTERPLLDETNLYRERVGGVDSPKPDELVNFVDLKGLAGQVGSQVSMEYWKSAPYFLNFMDGYQLSQRVKERIDEPDVRATLRQMDALRRAQVDGPEQVPPGNARLRALEQDTIGKELWKLLWLPPSMPYYAPSAAYARVPAGSATKRLLFSSWAATPSSVAALLSREATRAMQGGTSEQISARLNYDVDGDRPGGMSTLLLFTPLPGLAATTDPLTIARRTPDATLAADQVIAAAQSTVRPELGESPPTDSTRNPATWYWAAPFARWGTPEAIATVASSIGSGDHEHTSRATQLHLDRAEEASTAIERGLGAYPTDLDRWVAMVGLAGPANCAWRALSRVLADHADVSDDAILRSAAVIAEGFRSLFNRSEVMGMLDLSDRSRSLDYWQRVLTYCLSGNLQAVLDEYLHHLVGNEGHLDDERLAELADRIASSVSIGRARIEAFDPDEPARPLTFSPRFALRYGNARGTTQSDDNSVERLSSVQAAFNSPFWPMVLASTSVGQEGVDFHWWCHSLVHWNQPANVVDLEQREGRVHRFKGHAIRKNVGAAHRSDALRSGHPDPWVAAFEAAAAVRPVGSNELWPYWVYPGPAKVEAWVPYFPLSKEIDRAERMRRDRAIYRLAFGQPRQEDLLGLLRTDGDETPRPNGDVRIDLQPPAAGAPSQPPAALIDSTPS